MRKPEDSQLRHKVIDELEFDPSIDASTIAVAVEDGVVTVTGSVSDYAQKLHVDRAVKRVAGVRAVAEELVVKLLGADRSDTEIAHTALNNLRFNVTVPFDNIQVTVDGGWVTLEGEVEWQYQREAAENSIAHITGVRGLTNDIRITSRLDTGDLKSKIQSAFARRAALDAKNITIDAVDGQITLRGNVQSWSERRQAEDIAWSTPGVKRVEDRLVVMP